MPVGGRRCWFGHSVGHRASGGAGAGPEAGHHGRARRRLYRLPRRAGPRRVRWLLSASGRQAPGVPLPPAAELPRRPAAVPAHVASAGRPARRLPARDRGLFRRPARAVSGGGAPRGFHRDPGGRPQACPGRRRRSRPAGMRRLPWRRAGRAIAGRARPAGPAARLHRRPDRQLEERAAARGRARLHGGRGRQADAGGHQRAGGLAVVAAGARVLRRRTGGFARCPPSAAARRGVEGRP